MTRKEVQELMVLVNSLYPNLKVDNADKTHVIDSWHWMLEEYPADMVAAALKVFVKTSGSSFAPTVSQIIECINKPRNIDELSEGEAWARVKKAIRNGNYAAKEEFDELPESIQKAVGNFRVIQEWAMMDSDEVNSVIMSNFQRSYRAVLQKKDFNTRVPQEIKDRLENRGNVDGIEEKS